MGGKEKLKAFRLPAMLPRLVPDLSAKRLERLGAEIEAGFWIEESCV